jgi:hypothetical protein
MRRLFAALGAVGGTAAALALPGAAPAAPSPSPSVSGSFSPSGSVSPTTVQPGNSVTFSIVCADGVRSADVSGTPLGLSARIPMEPGKASGVFSASVVIPASTLEGTYSVGIDCADGTSSVVQLVVSPTGGVPTGGGSTAQGANRTLMAAGGGLLVIGAAGALMLRRRPS